MSREGGTRLTVLFTLVYRTETDSPDGRVGEGVVLENLSPESRTGPTLTHRDTHTTPSPPDPDLQVVGPF